ncbi:hypothetical protein NE237_011779 [Protea cynaroides]|uniref:Uncharacterized protein n=1 Tax=Protea cynaroides TaxID=273540 RepID=A0A9Q0GVJ9_9MAGN|nr:hypothetical protein NE237_011779 [Protea cynaroides]
MKKEQSCKLESQAASRKKAKPSTEMTTDVTETTSRKKRSAKAYTVLRCSKRLQNAISCTQGKDIEPVVETIDLRGSDEEDHQDKEQNHSYEEKKLPEEDSSFLNLEGKIDYLTLLLEAQEKYHEAMKSMGADTCFHPQNLSSSDIKSQVKKDKYKQLYINSQKKIETMQEENRQLAVKLEIARGKLEAYEKGHSLFSETIERLKDAMLISTLTKTTEMMFGHSSRANNGDCVAPTVAEAKAPVTRKGKKA